MATELVTIVTTRYFEYRLIERGLENINNYYILNKFSGEDADKILSGTFKECLDSLLDTRKNPEPTQDIANQIRNFIEDEIEFMKFSPFRDDGKVIAFYCLDRDDNVIVKNGKPYAYLNSRVIDYVYPEEVEGRNILALSLCFYQRDRGA